MTSKPHYEADTSEPIKREDNGNRIILYPKRLNIVWGKDSRYWRLPSSTDTSAELIQVSWLEVTGTCDLEANQTYDIKFRVSLTADAFGWNGVPVYVMAKFGKKGRYTWKRATLANKSEPYDIPADTDVLTIRSPDSNETTLYFGLYEVWSGKWKGGLKIHEAKITKKSITN